MPESFSETFASRAAYLQAVDAVLSLAQRELCIFDTDLKSLEFENKARAESIASFLAASRDRKIRIVLHDLDYLLRFSPRMMMLLKHYGHCITVRRSPESLRTLGDCFLLADGNSGVIRFHADHFRGKKIVQLPKEIHDWQQRFEDLWQESMPGASATHLGL